MYEVDKERVQSIVKKIGETLKERREELGLTKNQIKIKTLDNKTVARNTLAMLESGEFSGVRLSTLLFYCELLGLEVVIKKKDE